MLIEHVPEHGRAGDPRPEVLHPPGASRVHAVAAVAQANSVVNLGSVHRVVEVTYKQGFEVEGGIRGVNIKCSAYLVFLDELKAMVVPQVVGKTLNLVLKQKE